MGLTVVCALLAAINAIWLIAGRRLHPLLATTPVFIGLIVGSRRASQGMQHDNVQAAIDAAPRFDALRAGVEAFSQQQTHASWGYLGALLAAFILLVVTTARSVDEHRRTWRYTIIGGVVTTMLVGVIARLAAANGAHNDASELIVMLGAGIAVVVLGGLASLAQGGSNNNEAAAENGLTAALALAASVVALFAAIDIVFEPITGGFSQALAAPLFWTSLLVLVAVGRAAHRENLQLAALLALLAVFWSANHVTPTLAVLGQMAELRGPRPPPRDMRLPKIAGDEPMLARFALVLEADKAADVEGELRAERQRIEVLKTTSRGPHTESWDLALFADSRVPLSRVMQALHVSHEHDFVRFNLGGQGPTRLSWIGAVASHPSRRRMAPAFALVLHDDGVLVQAATTMGDNGYAPSPGDGGYKLPCVSACERGLPLDELRATLEKLQAPGPFIVVGPDDTEWGDAMALADVADDLGNNLIGFGYPPPKYEFDGAPPFVSLEPLGGPNWPPREDESPEPSDPEPGTRPLPEPTELPPAE